VTELILDGSKMASEEDFHDQVAAHPETPGYYGRNLDALHDVLTGYFKSPVSIIWKNADLARLALGKRYSHILDVFGDAEEDWYIAGGSLGVDLEITEDRV
jgi:ribonuclease inhibitor